MDLNGRSESWFKKVLEGQDYLGCWSFRLRMYEGYLRRNSCNKAYRFLYLALAGAAEIILNAVKKAHLI